MLNLMSKVRMEIDYNKIKEVIVKLGIIKNKEALRLVELLKSVYLDCKIHNENLSTVNESIKKKKNQTEGGVAHPTFYLTYLMTS